MVQIPVTQIAFSRKVKVQIILIKTNRNNVSMDDSDTQPKGVRACEPTWCRYLNKNTVKGFFLRCTALSSFKVGEMELLREKTGLRKTERETETEIN